MYTGTISCEQARTLVADGAQLVDVREPGEYHASAIPGAINIPLGMIPHARRQLDQGKPVLLYCATGRRSGMAKLMLEASGFPDVHNIISPTYYNSCR